MEVIRKKLSPKEFGSGNVRWDEGCNCVQTSFDGGATWVDNPGADPRSAPAFAAPPVASADPRCDGAERMIEALRRLINIVVETAGNIALASAILGYVSQFLFGIGELAALILEVVTGLLGVGQELINAAFTEDVYDQLKCIAYCDLGDDGHFTADGWTQFQDDVAAAFSGTIDLTMPLVFQLEGINGFNNAASIGTETGDCSDCPSCGPWGYRWIDAEIAAGDWSGFSQGELSNFGATGISLPDGSVTRIFFRFTWGGDGGGGDSAAAIWVPASTRVILVAPISTGGSPQDVEWFGDEISPATLQLGANGAAGSTTTITITEIEVEGTGTLPGSWTHGHSYTP